MLFRHKISFTQRISISIFLLILILGSALSFVFEKKLTQTLETEHYFWSKSMARAITKAVIGDTIAGNKRKVKETLKRIIKDSDSIRYISVIGFDGKYFASVAKQGVTIKHAVLGHTQFVGVNQQKHFVSMDEHFHDQEYRMIDNLDGHLHIGIDTSRTKDKINEMRTYLLFMIGTLAVAGLAISFYIGRRVGKPILQLSSHLQQFADDELEDVSRIDSPDREIRTLHKNFIRMVEQRNEMQRNLKYKQRQLLDLNSSLEGLVEERTREYQLAKNEAEEAMAARGIFLANMSHEIRTPMNAIIGMTHLALETDLDDKQRNFIDKAHWSAHSLLRILNDILDFSKIEAGKLNLENTDFKLEDVIHNITSIESFKAEEKNISFSTSIATDIPPAVNGDPLRLSQVLVNLCNNAIKFTPENGQVRLEVSLQEQQSQTVTLHFNVTDTGIGMTAQEQDQLFQPFSQADASTTRKYGGTGLGLMICKNLVELMDGKIWVESHKGQGSNFQFTIKLGLSDPDTVNYQSENKPVNNDIEAASHQLKESKILLVEDNEINQELAFELLVANGMKVEIVSNGQEAIDILSTYEFDGVLMDCQMPVMDGYTATRKLREKEKFADLPIIALTANVMKGDREKILAAGMNDLIGKPIDIDKMLLTMAKWIRH